MATDSVKKIFLFQIEKNNGDRNKIVSFLDTILFTQTKRKRKRNKNLKTPTSRTTLAYLKFSQCKFQKCFRIMKKVIMVHVCVCVVLSWWWYYGTKRHSISHYDALFKSISDSVREAHGIQMKWLWWLWPFILQTDDSYQIRIGFCFGWITE